jgi:hypothetical protein
VSIDRIRARAARNRSALFRRWIAGMPRPLRVIDLGGAAQMWRRWGITEEDGLQIVLANTHRLDPTHRGEASPGAFVSSIEIDVLDLEPSAYADYDVVFSNSMVEHLPSRDAQARLAARIVASGKPYFIQVPNKHCIVDPHFPHPFAAFFASWPPALQMRAIQWHPLGTRRRATSRDEAVRRIETYHPLAKRDLAALFPQARIETEWNLGLPMSLIAIGQGPIAVSASAVHTAPPSPLVIDEPACGRRQPAAGGRSSFMPEPPLGGGAGEP